jgi:hypothetical protein
MKKTNPLSRTRERGSVGPLGQRHGASYESEQVEQGCRVCPIRICTTAIAIGDSKEREILSALPWTRKPLREADVQ